MQLSEDYGDYGNIIIFSSENQLYNPDSTGRFRIKATRPYYELNVFRKTPDGLEFLFDQYFDTKLHPKPLAYLCSSITLGDPYGVWPKALLLDCNGIIIDLLNYDIDLRYPVDSFNVLIIRNKNVLLDEVIQGGRFPEHLKQSFEQLLQSGDKVLFTSILVKSDHWEHRELNSISLVI